MKKFVARIGTGLLAMALLGSTLIAPKMVQAKTSAMNSAKMSSTKRASKKMPSSKMGGKMSSAKTSQMTGTIVSMTPTSLTIAPVQKNKMGAKKTVGIPRSAKIMRSGVAVKLTSLKKGEKVVVMMKGGTVTSVQVVETAMLTSTHSGDASHKMPVTRKM